MLEAGGFVSSRPGRRLVFASPARPCERGHLGGSDLPAGDGPTSPPATGPHRSHAGRPRRSGARPLPEGRRRGDRGPGHHRDAGRSAARTASSRASSWPSIARGASCAIPRPAASLGRTEQSVGRLLIQQVFEALFDGHGERGHRGTRRGQGPGLGGQDQADRDVARRCGRQAGPRRGGRAGARRDAQPDRDDSRSVWATRSNVWLQPAGDQAPGPAGRQGAGAGRAAVQARQPPGHRVHARPRPSPTWT